MYKSYKIELAPNNKQKTRFYQCAGTARFIFNWGLFKISSAYSKDKTKITTFELSNQLTQLKKTKEYIWLKEISSWVPIYALQNLNSAFKNFFRNCKQNKKGKKGFPKFKQKGKALNNFTVSDVFYGPKHVKLPRIGKIRLKEHGYIPANSKVVNATITEHAGRWFISMLINEPEPNFQGAKDKYSQVGVDLGIKTLAVISDGQEFQSPKPLKKHTKKLKKLQRKHARCKGVKNREKARKKLAKCHYRVTCIRKDTLHKITTHLTKTKSRIVIEDLNVSGMMKNHKLSRAISDLGFYEFRRQLEYKGRWYNCEIILADRFFPSSKTCPCCNDIYKDLTLDQREWNCANCNTLNLRDSAAAKNLEVYPEKHAHKYNKQSTVSSTEADKVSTT